MKAEMWGGPLDGQTVQVPDHLVEVRFPCPGSAITLPAPAITIAVYRRIAPKHSEVNEACVIYRFVRTERIAT